MKNDNNRKNAHQAEESAEPSPLDPATHPQSQTAVESVESNSVDEVVDNDSVDWQEKLLRVQAEMENFRRRTRREMADQLKYASMPLIADLLDVVDNIARALAAVDGGKSAAASEQEGLVQGVKLVQTQLEQVLEKQGCRRIASVGQAFDPHLHSAIQMQASDQVPANHVLMETRSGFLLHDRVVRPAEVIVSTGSATS